jgi:HSP20 family protein
MALVPGPFGTLLNLQTALDALHRSDWLQFSPSAGGSYPPLNVFRKGDDFALVAEVPGISPSDLEIQAKGRTVRLSGSKAVKYPEKASVHRRERAEGRFDRSITLPIEVDQDRVTAECRDGVLAVTLPRAERDKPRSIRIG